MTNLQSAEREFAAVLAKDFIDEGYQQLDPARANLRAGYVAPPLPGQEDLDDIMDVDELIETADRLNPGRAIRSGVGGALNRPGHR
jgi:hypothetical protein